MPSHCFPIAVLYVPCVLSVLYVLSVFHVLCVLSVLNNNPRR